MLRNTVSDDSITIMATQLTMNPSYKLSHHLMLIITVKNVRTGHPLCIQEYTLSNV